MLQRRFATTLSRRFLLRAAGGTALAATAGLLPRAAKAAPPVIRYATAGGVGPNEIETVIFLDWMKDNVLKRHGKDYTLEMTATRGTPEVATLIAAGQTDIGTLSSQLFASAILKDTVPGGMKIITGIFDEGRPGYASNSYAVLKDSGINSFGDLKGKTVGINAFNSVSELTIRIMCKKNGIDRKDIRFVEINFPAIAAAIRSKRIDCGILLQPFLSAELAKGDFKIIFTNADAFGVFDTIFQVATNNILQSQPTAVKAYLDDYVTGLHWLYDPANRQKAIEITAAAFKLPEGPIAAYFLTPNDYYRDRDGCIQAAMIQGPVDALVEEQMLDRHVDMRRYVDLSFLPNACPA